ncbi:hypothetical protein F4860DRAFT_25995 [Xylaria cubensis]|nr:hypothetical protein F4860DRAFT_25995 [Xylaria cubensis]
MLGSGPCHTSRTGRILECPNVAPKRRTWKSACICILAARCLSVSGRAGVPCRVRTYLPRGIFEVTLYPRNVLRKCTSYLQSLSYHCTVDYEMGNASAAYLLDERRKLSFLFVYISLLPPSYSIIPPTRFQTSALASVEVIASSTIFDIVPFYLTTSPLSTQTTFTLASVARRHIRLTRQPG